MLDSLGPWWAARRRAARKAHGDLRWLALAACALLAWAGVTAVAETGVRAGPEATARGAALYATYCVACHREGGAGEPRMPLGFRDPKLIDAMPLDETSHAWHHDDEQLLGMILDGTPRSKLRMPVFRAVLSERDATDLIAYLKSFWSDRILACQGPAHMRCM